MQTLKFRLRRVSDGWEGQVELPGGFVAAGKGEKRADAMRKAAALATAVAKNPAMQALLPPQAQASLKAIRAIAKHPELRRAWRKWGKPGLKKLAKSLL